MSAQIEAIYRRGYGVTERTCRDSIDIPGTCDNRSYVYDTMKNINNYQRIGIHIYDHTGTRKSNCESAKRNSVIQMKHNYPKVCNQFYKGHNKLFNTVEKYVISYESGKFLYEI